MAYLSFKVRQGQVIAAVRLGAGFSQTDVARAMGVTQPVQLSRVENGHSCPTTQWLSRLARVLGVPTASLLPPDDDD